MSVALTSQSIFYLGVAFARTLFLPPEVVLLHHTITVLKSTMHASSNNLFLMHFWSFVFWWEGKTFVLWECLIIMFELFLYFAQVPTNKPCYFVKCFEEERSYPDPTSILKLRIFEHSNIAKLSSVPVLVKFNLNWVLALNLVYYSPVYSINFFLILSIR